MREYVMLMFLGYQTWMDIRKKEICLWLTGLLGVCGLIYHLFLERALGELFISVGIGVSFLGISLLTRGAVGMGDGWLLMAAGTLLNKYEMVEMVGMGLFLAAIWSLFLLNGSRMNRIRIDRKTEIPFVPFLLLGYLGGLFL